MLEEALINPLSLLEVSLDLQEESDIIEIKDDSDTEEPVQEVPSFDTEVGNRARQFTIPEATKLVDENMKKLGAISKQEQMYRDQVVDRMSLVTKERIHCTICDVHIGISLRLHGSPVIHPLLRVLVCNDCHAAYKQIIFTFDSTGHDNQCRWCGTIGSFHTALRFCVKCPFAFCEVCLFRNLQPTANVDPFNWACPVCNMEELWPLRALLWQCVSLLNEVANKKAMESVWLVDMSECCGSTWTESLFLNGGHSSIEHSTKWIKKSVESILMSLRTLDRSISAVLSTIPETMDTPSLDMQIEAVVSLFNDTLARIPGSLQQIRKSWEINRIHPKLLTLGTGQKKSSGPKKPRAPSTGTKKNSSSSKRSNSVAPQKKKARPKQISDEELCAKFSVPKSIVKLTRIPHEKIAHFLQTPVVAETMDISD